MHVKLAKKGKKRVKSYNFHKILLFFRKMFHVYQGNIVLKLFYNTRN